MTKTMTNKKFNPEFFFYLSIGDLSIWPGRIELVDFFTDLGPQWSLGNTLWFLLRFGRFKNRDFLVDL